MEVRNYTTTAAGGAGTGIKFYWQEGMLVDTAFETQKLAADESSVDVIALTGGFTLVDSSSIKLGAINNTVTAVSNAAIPVVSATYTAGTIMPGDTVLLTSIVNGRQISGLHFTVGTVGAGTFQLAFMAQIVAATTGSFRKVQYSPLFSPGARVITKITAANPAVVTFAVKHDFVVGEKITMRVPADFGMVQMDGLVATITAVDATLNTVTLNIDASAFTAFAFPVTAADDFTPAQAIAAGRATTAAFLALPGNPQRNNSFRGLALAAGVDSPAGVATNKIYWRAGTSNKM